MHSHPTIKKVNETVAIDKIVSSFSIMKPTWCTFHSVFWESKGFACFRHYLLILRGRCTNGTWYVVCVVSWLWHGCSETASVACVVGRTVCARVHILVDDVESCPPTVYFSISSTVRPVSATVIGYLIFCWPCIIMYHTHFIVSWSSTCVGRPSGGTTLAVFGESCVHFSLSAHNLQPNYS
jgi:hypothetical protein